MEKADALKESNYLTSKFIYYANKENQFKRVQKRKFTH